MEVEEEEAEDELEEVDDEDPDDDAFIYVKEGTFLRRSNYSNGKTDANKSKTNYNNVLQ